MKCTIFICNPSIIFLLMVVTKAASADYTIPEVKLEAFKVSGFRVSIPHDDGIKRFAFHGKLNGTIKQSEPGEISADIMQPTGDLWIYEDPKIVLHIGDHISYWVFVQYDFLGYRKDNLQWTVTELVDYVDIDRKCATSQTVQGTMKVCGHNKLIFEDTFDDEAVDADKWTVQKYLSGEPSFEYNYYSPEAVSVMDSKMSITPSGKEEDLRLRGILDLNDGCTHYKPERCYRAQRGPFYLPPVKSGMITSKFSFRYGRLEIDAKLPCGDWLLPEITLVSRSNPNNKLYIAYARGNEELTGGDGSSDIGGKLLFAGPVESLDEPERSKHLASTRNSDDQPFCTSRHNYTLVWKPDAIHCYVDDRNFGDINLNFNFADTDERTIQLGVRVGGIKDFPNNYNSRVYTKSWTNTDPLQMKKFVDARPNWWPTWGNKRSLIVYGVRVYSL